MQTMTCRSCGVGDGIAFCADTGDPVCAKCAIACAVCESPLRKDKAQVTSTGRKLCSKCMAERNARRKEKKEELRREAAAKKRAVESAGSASPLGGISFEDLMKDEPVLQANLRSARREEEPTRPVIAEAPKSGGTSFEDLMGSGASASPRVREEGLSGISVPDEAGKTSGLEGPAKEGSGRLALGPIDDNRPILTGSGYQPPTKRAYIAAFLVFGLAGAIFWNRAPGFREILMPWRTPKYAFSSGQMALTTDTNALRNTSNISQFDLFSQAPIFFVAWFFVLLYVGGAVMITWSTTRAILSSYLAKRRLKKAEEYAKKYGYKYPG